ncbi:MAG: hypothetical protein DRG59_13870 [Deltaproteobacteria bacterium]|nr:MAG: hypothetical protein DRG59_13870 [Deltaproteobacteria bacterium]
MEKRKVLIDWGYMGYVEDGEGDPVVFVHGAGNRGEVWSKLFGILRNHCRIIALDLPGHGESSCIQIKSVDDYTSEVLAFLDKMELENATLVGHSMGGAITIKAVPATDRITKGVLVGTGQELKVNPKLLDGLKTDFLQWAHTMAKWSFLKGAPEEVIKNAAEMMIEAGKEVLYNDMYACSTYSGTEALKNFNKPALIVCGEKDVMTPPDLSRELEEKIPNSKLELIPGAGHMVHQEQPEALASAILSFLET